MKKILTLVLASAAIILAGTAVYRFCLRKSIPNAPLQEQALTILKQNDCFVCHSSQPKMPFYASFPIMDKIMAGHVKHAVDFTDLEAATADMANIGEVPLSMIEHSVIAENMPIMEYRMIHWGTGFNDREEDILEAWIRDVRLKRFSNGLACGEFAAEGVQPIPDAIPTDPAKVAMGRRMFNDTRLSYDGTISCASCHLLADGGADESIERTSEGIYGQFGGVNAPTVYNAYYNVQQFWNGRAADLSEQAAGPPVNPVEMGAHTWEDIVAKLRTDKSLVAEFEQLYPGEGLTQATVTGAIAEFEKTLLTPDCRFDRYLKGDEKAISDDEEDGYEEFQEIGCATCHTGVILGGRSFEYLSIYGDYFADRDPSITYCADDDGLKGFTGKEEDLHKFKVPGLRNVALTAPYFHDGSMATLEDAVRAMAKYEFNRTLTQEQVREIVYFMQTLTGKNPNLKK